MTTELSLQSDVVKAVNDAGGFAFKMSHKFKSGVVDLFVKLPGLPAAFFEVKYEKIGPLTQSIKVEPTPLQLKFLRDAQRSGMAVGVLSFVQRKNQPRKIGIVAFSGAWAGEVADSSYGWVRNDEREDMAIATIKNLLRG